MIHTIKSIIIFFLFTSAFNKSLGADSLAFSKDRVIISIGYGFLSNEKTTYALDFHNGNTALETEIKPAFGPAFFKLEYAVQESMGIGFTINYSRYDKEVEPFMNPAYPMPTVYMGFEGRCISIMARINFHARKLEHPHKLDLYGGFGFGTVIRNYTFYSSDPGVALTTTKQFHGHASPYNNEYIFELTVGSRMYFTKAFGIYVEVGYSTSSVILANGGLIIKI
jgi:hypothetical protein